MARLWETITLNAYPLLTWLQNDTAPREGNLGISTNIIGACTLWPSNLTLIISPTSTLKFVQNYRCITDLTILVIAKEWAQIRYIPWVNELCYFQTINCYNTVTEDKKKEKKKKQWKQSYGSIMRDLRSEKNKSTVYIPI